MSSGAWTLLDIYQSRSTAYPFPAGLDPCYLLDRHSYALKCIYRVTSLMDRFWCFMETISPRSTCVFFPDQHQESNAAEFNTTKTSKSFTVVKMLMTLIHVTDTIACLPSRYIISVRTKYRPHNMDRFTCTTLGKSNRYSEDNSVCKHRVST